ncbi:MAG: endopeptidase La [Firmicutes bacterium]|nr:endopeptidase La [Bacillota bacterium]
MAEFIDVTPESTFFDSGGRSYRTVILRDSVILPGMALSIDITRDRSLSALNKAIENSDDIFIVSQRHSGINNPGPKDIHRVGTICRIKHITRLPTDIVKVGIYGLTRAEIVSFISLTPHFEVTVRELPYSNDYDLDTEVYCNMIRSELNEFLKVDSKGLFSGIDVNALTEPEKIIGVCCQTVIESYQMRMNILCETNINKQLELVYTSIVKSLEMARLEKKISAKVRKQIDKNQREYFLREQVKALHDELGDSDEDFNRLIARGKELKLPDEAMAKLEKEVRRLEKMSATSPEAGVSRTYIDWILDIPWSKASKDTADLKNARKILDEDHFGLEKVKERILEYLAVIQRTKSMKGPILCFVGPPGVGKTSIVKSIARTLDRKFVSMSLGGVHDEAEIRGHRRTYIGAIPGRVIYHIKQAGTVNPVFLFDEIDKMSNDFRGDPASAMLEVLDPEQNFQFRDHYLELPYDLSQVMFVTTANTAESIPAPLLDRMEVIELSGYTEEDKLQIARLYLIKKQLKAHGLDEAVAFEEAAVRRIINEYTRESGVRNLEREIANVCRKITLKLVEGGAPACEKITADDIETLLGVPKFSTDNAEVDDQIGAATGLAWTAVGGKTLTIEVSLLKDGQGEITLTGSLGDVMKESARTAITLIKAHAAEYDIDPSVFGKTDIHIHVPEGATPKDGPSAGITLATAIFSAFTEKPVSHRVAMTGEVTLRGRVLAIGGLKEKLLAARRAGIKRIIIPKENAKDLVEIPKNVLGDLEITPVSDIKEVFQSAMA